MFLSQNSFIKNVVYFCTCFGSNFGSGLCHHTGRVKSVNFHKFYLFMDVVPDQYCQYWFGYRTAKSTRIDCGSVADSDPGSGIWCLFHPWIRDGRKSASGSGIWDPGWTTRIIFFRDQKPFFCFYGVKILKFFDEDPGSGMETARIRDPGWKKSDPGSGIIIPDPPHWILYRVPIALQHSTCMLCPKFVIELATT